MSKLAELGSRTLQAEKTLGSKDLNWEEVDIFKNCRKAMTGTQGAWVVMVK